jgi:transposase-like protein
MELIDRIRKDIDDRLEELRPQIEEIPRLEAALAALEASSAGASAGPRRRARRGQRREELLQLVAGNPQITIAEAARQMGVSSPQVSTLVRRLEEEGVLERADGRFVVVAPAAYAARGGEEAGASALESEAKAGPAPPESETEPPAPHVEPPAPQEIQGPGVESIARESGAAEAESVPEPARDEADRPPAS